MLFPRRSALTAALLAAAAIGTSAAPASAANPCSAKGLHYKTVEDGVTYSVKVRKLRTDGAACSKARTIAKVVAKSLLKTDKAPGTAKGFDIKTHEDCTNCGAPVEVTATKGSKTVTFSVHGGDY